MLTYIIYLYHYLNVYIYTYIIGHICNWLRSSIVQAGCMFACNCTPTVVTRIYWVSVKECHYLVSFHSVLPSLECTLPALNRNNCFPSDDFLDSIVRSEVGDLNAFNFTLSAKEWEFSFMIFGSETLSVCSILWEIEMPAAECLIEIYSLL